jgi:DNA mismatch repair protein MutL
MRTRPERRPIRPLDEQLVNRIAAGEVVERPAAALKELIENAIDAGAARIEIEAEMGGRRLIRVRDDGIGMTRTDALNALQRHATSKIASDADLTRIATLGFRGEALPSIASVSRMEILTRAFEEDTGTHIVVEGGEVKTVEEVGAPIGTTVCRARPVLQCARPPEVPQNCADRTGAHHRDRDALRFCVPRCVVSADTRAAGTHLHAWQRRPADGGGVHLGARDGAGMVSVDYERDSIRVWGLIAPPHQTRPTRQHQYFFVNLRPVRNKTLTAALDEAYKTLTPEKRYPACILLVGIDPRQVDVNVHPAKIEVRFQREQAVFEAVVNAIRAALLHHGMIPSALPPSESRGQAITPARPPDAETIHQILMQRAGLAPAEAVGTPAPPETHAPAGETPARPEMLAHAGETPARPAPVGTPAHPEMLAHAGETPAHPEMPAGVDPFVSAAHAVALADETPPLLETEPLQTTHLPFAHLLDDLQILGQVRNTYIVASTRQGLVLIDQHVAHERVLYEQLCYKRGALPIPKQHLLTPETLQLSRRDALLLHEKLPELEAIGFELEPFGVDTYLIRAVPAALKGDPVQTLRDIVDELVELSVSKRLPVAREQIWITTSCKLAVKAGDPLSMPEMRKLIEDLARTENPYLCPHGRPITIILTWQEIERKFKRS